MTHYMVRTKLTPEAWKRFLANPEDRSKAARSGTADIGSEIVGYWYGLGEYDIYSVATAPDDETAAAIRFALLSSGTFERYDMSVLLTRDQFRQAAASIDRWPDLKNYRAPGASD